jgi:putative transposase
MDRYYMLAAAKYILLNPVRARLVKRPEDWLFSSIGEHLTGNSVIIDPAGLGKYVKVWKEFLSEKATNKEIEAITMHTTTGRPLGGESFIKRLEKMTGRIISKLKPGPPGKKGVAES